MLMKQGSVLAGVLLDTFVILNTSSFLGGVPSTLMGSMNLLNRLYGF